MSVTTEPTKEEIWDLIEAKAPGLADEIGWGTMDSLVDDIFGLLKQQHDYALASIKKDILSEVIGEDVLMKDGSPINHTMQKYRAELRERLERYIGS